MVLRVDEGGVMCGDGGIENNRENKTKKTPAPSFFQNPNQCIGIK